MTDKTREPGTVHRVKRARKEQACAECPVPIEIGKSYMFLNTHDERSGAWKRYILCPDCERHLNCFRFAEIACGTTDSYVAGKLRQEISDRCRMDNDFNHEYSIAWGASERITTDEASE